MGETEILESIRSHEARNTELLKRLGKIAGNEIRAIEHHFWVNNQRKASRLGKELYENGFLVLVICAADNDDGSKLWNVEAEFKQTIEEATSRSYISKLVRLAAKFDGIYDGWGTSI
jgi:regulator of RNase E activity RraB